MEPTVQGPRPRRTGHGRRVVLACALAVLLLAVATLTGVVRDRVPPVSGVDLDRIADAVRQGCDRSARPLEEGTGLALDGTVTEVAGGDEPGPVRVVLTVHEWFLGPPVDLFEVALEEDTVASVTGGRGLRPGDRLLVSGPGWDLAGDLPTAAGCGRTLAWDATTADAWRAELDGAAAVGPDGPLARYPAAGFVRTGAGGVPVVSGVLVRDGGCLYVQDGLTRWLPVFPAGTARWAEDGTRLLLGEDLLDVGHPIRLGGLPATGAVLRGSQRVTPGEVGARLLDEAGVPDDCGAFPRFVVAEPSRTARPTVTPMSVDDRALVAAFEAARRAGLQPTDVAGEAVRDGYGAHSERFVLGTAEGSLVVHVETVAFLAWPLAYDTTESELRWSGDRTHAPDLPTPPPGAQLLVLEHDDGRTQLMLRGPERVVVSVTGDGSATTERMAALAAVARAVALSPDAGES